MILFLGSIFLLGFGWNSESREGEGTAGELLSEGDIGDSNLADGGFEEFGAEVAEGVNEGGPHLALGDGVAAVEDAVEVGLKSAFEIVVSNGT